MRPCDDLALYDVILELIDRNLAGALVRIGVVADFEAGIEPLLDDRRSRVALTRHVQLALVDEDRDRNLLDLEGSHQPVGNPLEIAQVRHLVHDRAVVDGDGHAPRGRGLCVERGQGKRQRRGDRQNVPEHQSFSVIECPCLKAGKP